MHDLFQRLYHRSILDDVPLSAPLALEALPEASEETKDVWAIFQTLSALSAPLDPQAPTAVILAGGKGSRMGEGIKQKALAPIHGQPALLRSLAIYKDFGFRNILLIVGVGYKDVIQAVQGVDLNIVFLYQHRQLGTGHAARLASRWLEYQQYEGDILVTMGDKYITPAGLEQLLQSHRDQQLDLTLTTAAKEAWPDAGRIVMDNQNHVRAIVEKPDIVQKQLIQDFLNWPEDPIPCPAFLQHALQCWDRESKLKKLLGEAFWERLHSTETIRKAEGKLLLKESDPLIAVHDSLRLQAREVEEQCGLVNVSLYLFKSQALYHSLEQIVSNNAQGELYLTDAVYYLVNNHHTGAFRVSCSKTPNDYDVMGFNTLEELAQIENRLPESIK